VLDQVTQQVEGARLDVDRLTAPVELVTSGVQLVVLEALGVSYHRCALQLSAYR
jgi:hypothetical protein